MDLRCLRSRIACRHHIDCHQCRFRGYPFRDRNQVHIRHRDLEKLRPHAVDIASELGRGKMAPFMSVSVRHVRHNGRDRDQVAGTDILYRASRFHDLRKAFVAEDKALTPGAGSRIDRMRIRRTRRQKRRFQDRRICIRRDRRIKHRRRDFLRFHFSFFRKYKSFQSVIPYIPSASSGSRPRSLPSVQIP